jgi:hypothetical protein
VASAQQLFKDRDDERATFLEALDQVRRSAVGPEDVTNTSFPGALALDVGRLAARLWL